MPSIVVNGANLEYKEQGRGEPVVFVHGGLSDYRTWTSQMSGFPGYRTITYSRRYHWPNEMIPDRVDDQMTPHVKDLASLLRKVDAAPAHLIGNSWGAFVCLMLAVKEPSLVRSLVLGEPPVLPLFVSTPPSHWNS